MSDLFAAAHTAVAISIASVLALCVPVSICVLAAWWLLRKMTPPPQGKYIDGVWISGEDLKRFSGLWVAIDPTSDELIAASSTLDRLVLEVERHHPERRPVGVLLPGEPCPAMSHLLSPNGSAE